MMPDQVDAIRDLMSEANAFAVEVSAGFHMSLAVMSFTRLPDRSEDDDAVKVRFFNVSVAGTVREQAGEEQVAA